MNGWASIPNPDLSPKVNRIMVRSEIGGIHLADLPNGASLEIETENHLYSIVKAGPNVVSISGHPRYCPSPIEVQLEGPNSGGSLLKTNYVGRGMRLEFWHPAHEFVTTSRIRCIRQRT